MLYECQRQSAPRWWALMVLLAPVTTPYYIIKSRKGAGTSLVMIFLALFSIVIGVEFYLYKDYMEKNKYSHLPPITQKMIALSEEVKRSTIELDKGLVKLEALSKVESRIKEIKSTLDFITELRIKMNANKVAIDKLIKYTQVHKDYFKKKDLSWVYNIQNFYNNWNVIQHHKSLEKYLNSFEDLLKYTYLNFYYITEHKNPEHLNNYDEYYIRYRRSVDSHNRFNVKRIDFQNIYLKKYPNIVAYLPGERLTDTFRLWE